MNKIIHKELSYEITGLFFKVHRKLGRFCREIQYADEFEKLLIKNKINYKREYKLKDFVSESPKGNIVDFLIEEKIIIDFKSKKFVTKEDYVQMQRYLQSVNLELDMIINFRNTYLKPTRVLNSRYSGFVNSNRNKSHLDHSGVHSGNLDVDSGHSDRSKGFTLVETIIYVAIIGGVIATFVSFSMNISNARNKTYVQEETQANARVALNIITQKIQSASGVNISASVFGIDPGVLSLAMSSSTLNPTIINLSADDGQLQIKEGNNATTTITTERVQINNLIFTNFSASSTRENIGVDLTVGYVSSTDINFQSSPPKPQV